MAVLKTIIGNVRGPKGDKGDQGIQGPVGPVGPKGDMQDITGKLDKGNLPSNLQNAEQIYNELKKITDTLKTEKLDMGNLPEKVTNAGILLKLIEKQAGGQFDPNVIYLNFAYETKKVGYLYFDFNFPGIFKCIKETTKGDNTPEYFVNVSNLENHDRLSNLYEYKIEKIDFHTGNVFFEKIGKIGIISICNIFHREDYSDVVYIDIPAWFMFSRSDGVILGSLTSSAGCIGELLVVSNKQIEVLSSDKGRVSLSGQLIVKLKA